MFDPIGQSTGWPIAYVAIGAWHGRMTQYPATLPETATSWQGHLHLSVRVEMSAFSNHLRVSRDSMDIQASRSGEDARVPLYTRCLQPAYYCAIEELIL